MVPCLRPGPGRRLSELLRGIIAVEPRQDRAVLGVSLDSRRVERGGLFLACAGERVHGIRYVDAALAAGAAAVAYDPRGADAVVPARADVPFVAVPGLAGRAGTIAARFYDEPARALQVIGVTGTNGKTSVAHFLAQALGQDGPCGVIGTLGYGLPGDLRAPSHTTPDPVTLQAELARLRDAGATHVAMEVSSHALAQDRARDVTFRGAVFTNLSRDHLDYHGDLSAYGEAKRRLFHVPGLRFAAVNRDDAFGRELAAAPAPGVVCADYGLGERTGGGGPWVAGEIGRASLEGLDLRVRSSWGDGAFHSPLIGAFNAQNLLAVLTVLLLMDIPLVQALDRAARLKPVPGRMERIAGAGTGPLAIVDYAHTPDALEQVLATLRPLCRGRLTCVFGCGGERDRGKRPLMGGVAARYADRVVLTDDNPRGEDPEAIVAEIAAGLPAGVRAEVVHDRGAAIHAAVTEAGRDDIVLIAGKGHESYQEVGAERRAFSDRAVVAAALEGRA